jgi:DNA invertase Pin-like site-specific DNA recombinase
MKAIALIRTSTEAQEVESQRKELLEYAKSFGYSDIVVVGGHASAIKADEAYRQNIQKVYNLIQSEKIDCVFAWAIDRIGRWEEILMEFKNFLISNKVNLIIKEPTLQLLNADGSVNSGMELTFTLFSTLAKQEMENKKARFRRAKKRNAEQSVFNGGVVRYGYKVVDKKIVPDEHDADVVRLAFTLYATGKYSCLTLTNELNERDLGKTFTLRGVDQLLKSTAYIGYSGQYNYIPIIDKELFDKVQAVLKSNNWTKQTKHQNLCSNLIICPVCGSHFSTNLKLYKCWRHAAQNGACDNKVSISIDALDSLIWYLVKTYYPTLAAGNKEEREAKAELLKTKIATLEKQQATFGKKRERIQDGYENGIYSKEKWSEKIAAINAEEIAHINKINKYKEELHITGMDYTAIVLDNLHKVESIVDFEEQYKIVKYMVKEIVMLDCQTIIVRFYHLKDMTFKYYKYNNRQFTDYYVKKFFQVKGGQELPLSFPKLNKKPQSN